MGGLLADLRGFLEGEELEDVTRFGAKMLGYILEVDDIGFDSVALAFDFELHAWHDVSVAFVHNSRRDVQHSIQFG